jgi:hypothetical protein
MIENTKTINELSMAISNEFIAYNLENIIDNLIPALKKAKKGESVYFKSSNYDFGNNRIYNYFEIHKGLLRFESNQRSEQLTNIKELWEKHKEEIKIAIKYGCQKNFSLAFNRMPRKISEGILGFPEYFMIYKFCNIDTLKLEIEKLELHYTENSYSRPGRDTAFIEERTIRNLDKVKNLIYKTIICIGLKIDNVKEIEKSEIIEREREYAYSPGSSSVEVDSKTLKNKLYFNILSTIIELEPEVLNKFDLTPLDWS